MSANEMIVPKSVATCPYCGAGLIADPYEWDGLTGVPTKSGFHLWCSAVLTALNAQRDTPHEEPYPYMYWLPVEEQVYNWMVETQQQMSTQRMLNVLRGVE